MTKLSFTFTDEQIDMALRANGYHDLWHPENWVHDSDKNPDWAGRSKMDCFVQLLKKSNLL